MIVVLDIDETLIHSGDDVIDNYDFILSNNWKVRKRPHLDFFLNKLFTTFHVGFWSAGSTPYITEVLSYILNPNQIPEFIFTFNDCMNQKSYPIKPLKLIQPEIYLNVLLIDDNPENIVLNPHQSYKIEAWEDDINDKHLLECLEYLMNFK
jgi:TFIIF-interacting CTD phosphatase-like protein